MGKAAELAKKLRDRGFDRSSVSDGHVHVACSQCQALAINGVACHESGCPNQKGAKY